MSPVTVSTYVAGVVLSWTAVLSTPLPDFLRASRIGRALSHRMAMLRVGNSPEVLRPTPPSQRPSETPLGPAKPVWAPFGSGGPTGCGAWSSLAVKAATADWAQGEEVST